MMSVSRLKGAMASLILWLCVGSVVQANSDSFESMIRQQIDQDLQQQILGYKDNSRPTGLPGSFSARTPIYRYEHSTPRPHPTTPNLYVVSVVDQLLAQRNPRLAVVREYLYFANKNEKGELALSRVEAASSDQFVANLRQDTNLPRAFMSTLKAYPAEYGKFNAAMIALEMVSCFGGSTFSDFVWRSSTDTPICVDHLIKALTTLEGNIGFFSFILGNRIMTSQLNNLAVVTASHFNRPLTTERLLALRPLMGYAGMSFGMMAQQITTHILTIPTFKECSKDILAGRFNTPFCVDAAKHFISAEKFWLDFGASLPSLLGGAVMSSGTHWLMKNHRFLFAKDTAKALTHEGLSSALKTMRGLRMTKNLVSVSGGPPGWMIAVGETVIFLAWTQFLEIPTMQMVWTAYDRPDIKSATKNLVAMSNSMAAAKGFSPDSVDISCRKQRFRGGTAEKCNSEEKLSETLKSLQFHARRYRERVILARLQRYYPDQMMKWEKYVTHYVTAKQLLQNIYAIRAKQQLSLARESQSLLGLYDTSFIVVKTWENYFQGRENEPLFLKSLQSQLQNISGSFQELNAAYSSSSSQTLSLEKKLIDQMIAFKKAAQKQYPFSVNESQFCYERMSDPNLCSALRSLKLIPQDPLDFYNKERNADIYNMVVQLKSLDMISPVAPLLYEFLCGGSELRSKDRFGWGLPAKLEMPRLVKNFKNDPAYEESCFAAAPIKDRMIPEAYGVDPEDNTYKALPLEKLNDLFDVFPRVFWETESMVYVDPLSLLVDPVVALTPGLSERDAQVWWNRQMAPDVVNFYVRFIRDFKKFLDKNLFSRMDESPSSVLLEKNIPTNSAVKSNHLSAKISDNKLLNLSLVGHMQTLVYALEKAHQIGTSSVSDRSFQAKKQKFLSSYAEHTRHFRYKQSPEALEPLLQSQIQQLVAQPLDADPAKFSRLVTETLFEDSYRQKNNRQRDLQQQLGEWSEALTGENINRIQNIEKRLNFTASQVAQMPAAEYRKYTILQIIQHMSLLIDETTSYYDNYVYFVGLFNFLEKQ